MLLEGLEVVFIVLTFGANTDRVQLAALAAVAAVVLVTATGFVVRPTRSSPREPAQVRRRGDAHRVRDVLERRGRRRRLAGGDAALPVLALGTAVLALVLVAVLRAPAGGRGGVKALRAVGEVVKDLVIGDDWRVILGIALTLLGVTVVHNLGWPAWWVPPLGASIMLIIGVTTDPPDRRRP